MEVAAGEYGEGKGRQLVPVVEDGHCQPFEKEFKGRHSGPITPSDDQPSCMGEDDRDNRCTEKEDVSAVVDGYRGAGPAWDILKNGSCQGSWEAGQPVCFDTVGTSSHQPSAHHSPLRNDESGHTSAPLLSLNKSHVCQRCSTAFVMFSSLRIHMVTFHGENLYSEQPASSTPDGYSGGGVSIDHGVKREVKIEEEGNDGDENTEKQMGYHGYERQAKYIKEEVNTDDENTGKVCYYGDEREVNYMKEEVNIDDENADKKVGYHEDKNIQVLGFHGKGKEVGKRKDKADDSSDKKGMTKKDRRYMCDVCSKDFTRYGGLKTHKLIHTGYKPFVCDMCNKTFTQAGSLQKHKLFHAGDKPFVCNVCSKAFTLAGDLKRHKLIHTGQNQKAFVCDVCCKAFTQANNLKRHKLIHTGHKQFVCDICSKAFTQAASLKTHKLMHSGHKPFVCDVCSKAFNQAGNLKNHKLIHTGHKQFVCDVCSKAFTLASTLKKHKLIHSGHKPFM